MDVPQLDGRSPALSAPCPLPRSAPSRSLPAWLGGRLEVAAQPRELASRVAALLLQERLLRPERPLGLATGRTMEPVYAALVQQVLDLPVGERTRIARQWSSFNLDEYVGLGPGDPRSFAAAMDRFLVAPLGLDPRRVRLPEGQADDPDLEAGRYAAAMAAAGGIGLQLLGLGANGHVGFNEPPCGPNAPARCVFLSEATLHQNAAAFGGDPAQVPPRAITLGLAQVLQADTILLVVSGSSKAGILRRLLREAPHAELPASWLQTHPGLRLMVDRAALEV